MNELTRADAWLDELLGGDALLADVIDEARYPDGVPAVPNPERVFEGVAPADALEPFVIYSGSTSPTLGAGQDLGASDNDAIGTERVLTSTTLTVRAVMAGTSYRPLEPIADRLDDLLHGAATVEVAALDPAGAAVVIAGCKRTTPLKYPEVADGRQFRHLGGVYRLWLHRAP